MTLLYLVYGVAATLALISVILGIMNLRGFLLTSSKISLLEEEVNKRAAEFDSLRKNTEHRQSIQSDPEEYSEQFHDSEDTPQDQEESEKIEASDGIQIVRNVRGPYDTGQPEQPSAPLSPEPLAPPLSPMEELSGDKEPVHAPRSVSSTTEPFVESEQSDPLGEPKPPVTVVPPRDTVSSEIQSEIEQGPGPSHGTPTPSVQKIPLAPSSPHTPEFSIPTPDSPPRKPTQTIGDPVVIPVYSDTKKDADFVAAWESFTSILPRLSSPDMQIDLAGVLFLYEEEIKYLEEMKRLVDDSGGNLGITNCHQELQPVILNHPTLASTLTSE